MTTETPSPRPPGSWFHRLRLRVLAVVAAGTLAVIGLLGWLALPAIPVVSVALITVAAVVNKMTTRLSQPVCRACGESLEGREPGLYGVVCDHCGAISDLPGLGPTDTTRRV